MLRQHNLNLFPPCPASSLPHLLLRDHLHAPPQHSPEPLSLVVEGPWVSAVGGLVELWQKGLARLLAGVVGELDRDGLGCAWWLLSIQALDGLLSLYPLIKADEAHTSGATCGASRSQTNTGPFYFTGFRHPWCNNNNNNNKGQLDKIINCEWLLKLEHFSFKCVSISVSMKQHFYFSRKSRERGVIYSQVSLEVNETSWVN